VQRLKRNIKKYRTTTTPITSGWTKALWRLSMREPRSGFISTAEIRALGATSFANIRVFTSVFLKVYRESKTI